MLTSTQQKPNIYHTLDEQADQYITKPNIYHTLGEHADQYTRKPNIYHTLGEQAVGFVVYWSAGSPRVW
jgi:hypothetical protein